MINRVPDYIEDENSILYDVDLPAENGKKQAQFFRKLDIGSGA